MKRSNGRQEAIRGIVRAQSIRTQNELVAALGEQGFSCTQATVSRDVSEMHLRKLAGGFYVLEEDLNLQLVLSEFVVETRSAPGQALVVVLTQPETAQSVARVIDEEAASKSFNPPPIVAVTESTPIASADTAPSHETLEDPTTTSIAAETAADAPSPP